MLLSMAIYVEKDICAVNLNVLTDLCFNNN